MTPTLACDVCGSRRHRREFTLRFDGHPQPFQLWKCRDCGLVFNWPRLPDEALHDQYDGDYYFFNQPPARRWSRATQLYLEQLLELESLPSRTLLDVGCGRGDLLALARERGWRVRGIDLSSQAAQQARQEHDIEVSTGTIEQCRGDIGLTDVVISSDVIEHVESPASFVIALHGMLCTGGTAIIETPNWGSAWRRLAGPRWLGLNRFHVYFFNEHNLPRLMKSAGFADCQIRTSTNTAHSQWGARPELEFSLDWMPKGLRWRAERALNQLTPPTMPVRLRRQPPASLDEALRHIERTEKQPKTTPDACTWRDNLAVIGRA